MTGEKANGLPHATERALKVVLMTDLVDSTALVDRLGDSRSTEVFQAHEQAARDLLTDYDGLEIDSADGFLFLFDRPADAVGYALSYHEALAQLSTELGVQLTARVAIHLGELLLRKNPSEYIARGAKPLEIEGLAKPVTARLMSLAHARQTLLTRPVFDVARRAAVGEALGAKDIVWLEHGFYRLKGVTEPQQVYEVGRRGIAPLKAPCGSDKAVQDTGMNLGWRPAPGRVPGLEGWRLTRRIGHSSHEEIWLAREETWVPNEVTLGNDDVIPEPVETAFAFSVSSASAERSGQSHGWRLRGPVDCLAVISGADQGLYAVLQDDLLRCGRDPKMELRVQDPRASRRHFEVRGTRAGHYIRALQAKNGVFVNGRRIETEEWLQTGDVITIGDTDLVYYAGGSCP